MKGDSMRLKIREARIRVCKRIIKKAVRRLDALHDFSFVAYSWAYDDEIDYHVIKERSTLKYHQFGTHVERYDEKNVRAGMGSF